MLQQIFNGFPLKHGQNLFQVTSLLLQNLFSWSTGIWWNMWTQVKGSASKVNVILVAFPFPFSTLYVFTFSDLNNWHQNLGMFHSSVASRDYPVPWNNITWSRTPFQLPRPPVMVMHFSILLPTKAVFTLLYVSTTPTLNRGSRKLTHGPGTWFASLAGSLPKFCVYLHKDEIPWVKTDSL